MGDKERLKQLSIGFKEILKEHRKSRRSSKFDTFLKYILNEDIYPSARKRFLKELMEYQYLMGKCKGNDSFVLKPVGGEE